MAYRRIGKSFNRDIYYYKPRTVGVFDFTIWGFFDAAEDIACIIAYHRIEKSFNPQIEDKNKSKTAYRRIGKSQNRNIEDHSLPQYPYNKEVVSLISVFLIVVKYKTNKDNTTNKCNVFLSFATAYKKAGAHDGSACLIYNMVCPLISARQVLCPP